LAGFDHLFYHKEKQTKERLTLEDRQKGREQIRGGWGSSYVEIFGVNVAMLGEVEVLLRHKHSLCIFADKASAPRYFCPDNGKERVEPDLV
jgi:hypothetical protein